MANTKNWSGNPIQPTGGAAAIAADLQATTKSWVNGTNPPTAKLLSNNIAVGLGTVVGDLVECVFTSYAAVVTSPVVLADSNGNTYLAANSPITFTCGAIGVADVAYGWYLVDGSSGALLAVELFDAPFNFNENGDRLSLVPRFYVVGRQPIANPGS